MPEIDGTELVFWLAERHCTAEIIIATGFNPTYAAVADTLGQAKGLNSVTTLTKPIALASGAEVSLVARAHYFVDAT